MCITVPAILLRVGDVLFGFKVTAVVDWGAGVVVYTDADTDKFAYTGQRVYGYASRLTVYRNEENPQS